MLKEILRDEIEEEVLARGYETKDLDGENELLNEIESILAERYGVDESNDEQYERFHKMFVEAL